MLRTLQIFSILTLLVIVLGIPRGFDFSDEGLYVLLADPNQLNTNGPILYDLFFKLIHKFSGIQFHIQELRWVRLIGILSSVFALYFFTNQLWKEKSNSGFGWILFLGLLCSYSFLPPSLSYNSLLLIGTSWWLYFLSKSDAPSAFLSGAIVALLCYVKLPAAGLLMVISLVLFWVKWRSKVVWILLGFIATLSLWELVFYWNFSDGLLNRSTFYLTNSIPRPSYELLPLLKSSGVGVFWISLAFSISYLMRKFSFQRESWKGITYFLGIFFIGLIAWFTHITHEWNHLVLLFTGVLVGWVFGEIQLRNTSLFNQPYLIMLLVLPFVLHFGSNVYWLRLGIHFWIFWILALYLFWENGRKFIGFGIGPLTFLLVLNGIWLNPFEQRPLWEAEYEWKYGADHSIFLNEEQITLLENLQEIKKVTQSNEIACAYRNPGMAYLVGMKNWGKIGFWEKSELESHISERLLQSMIFYHLDSLPPSFGSGFHRKSIGSYQEIDIEILWE